MAHAEHRKRKTDGKNNYRIDNTYLKATFEEISTPLFSIMDQHISSEEPIKIYTRADDYHAVWFCATFAGHATCCYNSVIRSEEWNKGDANLLKCDGVDSCVHFPKNTPFHMMEIMLSHDYLRELAIHYPDLLGGKDFETVLCNGLYRAYRKNRPFGPGVYKALHDIRLSQLNGNMASMYADAKIRRSFHFFWPGRKKKIIFIAHVLSG